MIRTVRALTLAGACAWAASLPSHAYEIETHAVITSHAARASLLSTDPTLLQDLGLTETAFGTSPTTYFDMDSGDYPVVRLTFRLSGQHYEDRIAEALESLQSRHSPASWLVRGAIREDDYRGMSAPLHPEPNVPGPLFRVLNHFFDPVRKRALTLEGAPIGTMAPDWALGTSDAFGVAEPDRQRQNHYSLPDAREAMWRALTLTDRTGRRIDNQNDSNDRDDEPLRLAYWKTAFRALGGVIHLLQDMAQPQHTRDEAHSGLGPERVEDGLSGRASVYEQYMRERTLAGHPNLATRGTVSSATPLSYELRSPIPKFPRYSDYWSTNTPDPDGSSGRGLADLSNHGFLTAAKNIGNTEYSKPSPFASDYELEHVPGVWPTGPTREYYLVGSVADLYAPANGRVGVPLARSSVWSHWLARPRYFLDTRIYDQMASMLVPRAVSYSAGLLNHFFRGRIEVSLTQAGVFSIVDSSAPGFTTVRAKVTNVTSDSLQMHDGVAVAVATFHPNTCFNADLSGQMGLPGKTPAACRGPMHILTSAPIDIASLPAGQSIDATFDFADTPIPFSATDLKLQVVYRGGLDQEQDTVIAATLDVAEPTPFDLLNMTDYFLYDSQFYPVPRIYDTTTIPSQIDPALFAEYIDTNGNGIYNPGIDRNLERRPLLYRFTFSEGALGTVQVPSSSYARMMLLAPRQTLTLQLSKINFGYTVPIEIQPVISDQTRADPPSLFRGNYVYQTSPDFMFDGPLIPITEDMELAPLEAGPTPIALTF